MLKNKKTIFISIATIIFFAGLGIAIYLVQQNQEIRKKASSGAACSHSSDCLLLDNPGNSGSHTAPRNILYIDITNQTEFRFNPGSTNDGCYNVNIQGNQLTWSRIGSGSSCKDISNIQIWMGNTTNTSTPTQTPTITATVTPTRNPSHTSTPSQTASPSPTKTPTPTPTASITVTPTSPPGSTSTPTPTTPPGSTSTPTATAAVTVTATITISPTNVLTQNSSTPTPTTGGAIAAVSPTPGGDTLPQAGVGSVTIIFSALGVLVVLGAFLLAL